MRFWIVRTLEQPTLIHVSNSLPLPYARLFLSFVEARRFIPSNQNQISIGKKFSWRKMRMRNTNININIDIDIDMSRTLRPFVPEIDPKTALTVLEK